MWRNLPGIVASGARVMSPPSSSPSPRPGCSSVQPSSAFLTHAGRVPPIADSQPVPQVPLLCPGCSAAGALGSRGVGLPWTSGFSCREQRMSLRFEVCLSGSKSFLCEVQALPEDHCWVLKQQISDRLGICKCKIALKAGSFVVRDGLCVRRLLPFLQQSGRRILSFVTQEVVLTTAAELHARGVCFKCMKEAGAQASDIIGLPIPVDVVALRTAGFSLADLLRARDHLALYVHPPVTNRTLFDSQLQAGRFTAGEFRDAGFPAEDLSENFFFRDGAETLTAGELEWEPCCAFFTAAELRSGGYTVRELKCACFDFRDVASAGYTGQELLGRRGVACLWRGGRRRRRRR